MFKPKNLPFSILPTFESLYLQKRVEPQEREEITKSGINNNDTKGCKIKSVTLVNDGEAKLEASSNEIGKPLFLTRIGKLLERFKCFKR